MNETVIYEMQDNVAIVTLNRPAVHNALNSEVREGIDQALRAAANDGQVRALVLTGAGCRAFSAGLDLTEFRTRMGGITAAENERQRSLRQALLRFTKPTVAAVNGLAIGGGVELALQCDVIIASASATFAFAEVQRGIMPGNGGTQLLPRRIGRSAALELLLTGRTVTAKDALAIGLVDHVTEPVELLDFGLCIARAITANAPLALMAVKRAVREGLELRLDDALALESALNSALYETPDAREGVLAFAEKRPPRWTGG